MSDENKMGVEIIEFYFHKIDKINDACADLSFIRKVRFFKKNNPECWF